MQTVYLFNLAHPFLVLALRVVAEGLPPKISGGGPGSMRGRVMSKVGRGTMKTGVAASDIFPEGPKNKKWQTLAVLLMCPGLAFGFLWFVCVV